MKVEIFQKQVAIGSNVKIMLTKGENVKGCLTEIGKFHITMHNENGSITILWDLVGGWEVLTESKEIETTENKQFNIDPKIDDNKTFGTVGERISKNTLDSINQQESKKITEIARIESEFNEKIDIYLEFLPPNFIFPEKSFSKIYLEEARKEWVRIKNKYEYISKMKEYKSFTAIISSLRELLVRFPNIPEIYYNIGCLECKVEKYIDALETFKKIVTISDNSDYWFNLAATAHYLEREALTCYALEKYFLKCCPNKISSEWCVFIKLLPKFQNYRVFSNFIKTHEHKIKSLEKKDFILDSGLYILISSGHKNKAIELFPEIEIEPINQSRFISIIASLILDLPQVPTEDYQSIIEEMSPKQLEFKKHEQNLLIEPTGYITSYDSSRGYGFIESVNRKTYFFHISSVDDISLKVELEYYKIGQRIPVNFSNQVSPGHKYEMAVKLTKCENITSLMEHASNLAKIGKIPDAIAKIRTVLKIQPENEEAHKLEEQWKKAARPSPGQYVGLPKGKGPYARAKRAEQADENFLSAEKLYKEAIEINDNFESAIKDLASLLQRENRISEAISLLKQNEKRVHNKRSLNNVLANLYQQIGEHKNAIEILKQLLADTSDNKKPAMLRRIAFSEYKSQNYDDAENTLRDILSISPTDPIAQRWLDAIRIAKDSGEFSQADQIIAREILSDFAIELSTFAKFYLDRCDIQYVEPKKIQTQEFSERDVNNLENLAKDVRTKLPRERAAIYLSAAKILSIIKIDDDYKRFRNYLLRHFASMGDAAVKEGRHIDVARSFYCEALNVYDWSKGWDEQDAVNSITRYLFSFIDISSIPAIPKPVKETVKQVFDKHPESESIFGAILYISTISRDAASRLLTIIYGDKKLRDLALVFISKEINQDGNYQSNLELKIFLSLWETLRKNLADKLAQQYTEFASLQQAKVTTDSMEEFIKKIDRIDCSSDLDRQRLNSLHQIAQSIFGFCHQTAYEDQASSHFDITEQCNKLKTEIEQNPTKLSIENVYPIIEHLLSIIEEAFGEIKRTSIPIVSVDLPMDSYVPNENLEIKLQLSVRNEKKCSPASNIEIIFDQKQQYYHISPLQWSLEESLRGGEIKTIEIPLHVTSEAILEKAFPMHFRVKYQSGSEIHKTDPQDATIRFEDEFVEIENPYSAYAGGGPVDDPAMFYGRDEMISNLVHAIRSIKSRNKCVLIYGQKRAGKTSVLNNLAIRLQFPILAINFNVQDIGPRISYESFLYLILLEMKNVIDDEVSKQNYNGIEFSIPSITDFGNQPLLQFHNVMSEFQKACKMNDRWKDVRIVLLIDEFTDLHKEIQRGNIPETFMKNWKALIEKKYFGAVLVGQDVMLKFKNQFSNEFGSTQDERITYLTDDNAKQLIEKPIKIGGPQEETRYKAKAVERILELTASSPFYIQIFCDRLVQYMNHYRVPRITEVDVEKVKNDLISGVNPLTEDKFDNLLNAGDASLEDIDIQDKLKVLKVIAERSKTGWCSIRLINTVETQTPIREILKDLQDRDVLKKKKESDDYQIQVGLFKEWLLHQ